MIFSESKLSGAFLIIPERREDERGFFARTFCAQEFGERGMATSFVQSSISFNAHKGTLRGFHYQAFPHAETKLVRCTMGSVYDVIVDLRPDSPTFKRWDAFELTHANRRAVYIPKGLAHGFLTLADGTEILYQMTELYEPRSACGVCWNAPGLDIPWPTEVVVVSVRDKNLPCLPE